MNTIWFLEFALVPALITAAGIWIASQFQNRLPSYAPTAIVSIGWWLSLAFALWVGNGLTLWPDEIWQRALWPLLIVAVFGGGTVTVSGRTVGRANLLSVMIILLAWCVLPRGDDWKDWLADSPIWLVLIFAASLFNGHAVERLLRRKAQNWGGWILVAAIAAPLIIALSTYASLAEWALAGLASTAVVALAPLLLREAWPVQAIVYPAACLASALVACDRFYTFSPRESWMYLLMLFFPAIVADFDVFIAKKFSGWGRVILAALLAGAVIVIAANPL